MGYLWVFTRLTIYFISHGRSYYTENIYFSRKNIFLFYSDLKNSYKLVENPLKICQALSVLEIIHPIINFTKGDWTSPLIQVKLFELIVTKSL
jgi:hypothetical protein